MRDLRHNRLSMLAEVLKGAALSLMLLVWTFPANDYAFSTGIDPPLSWVFNYLIAIDPGLGEHIIFPHGPLAFLTYPLYFNILATLTVNAMLKVSLLLGLFRLLPGPGRDLRWLGAFALSFAVSFTAGFHHLLMSVLLLCYLVYYHTGREGFKYGGFVLTALALFVKSYTAVMGGVITGGFLLYQYLRFRSWRTTLRDLGLMGLAVLILWVGLYGSPWGLPRYLLGIWHLAQDNSSAASLYPQNDWWVLGAFFLLITALVIIDTGPRAIFYWALAGFPLFAFWKHGMAREDVYHVRSFFISLSLVLLLWLLFLPGRRVWKSLLAVGALLVFSLNMPNALHFEPARYELNGPWNLQAWLSDPGGIRRQAREASEAAIAGQRLGHDMRQAIGKSTVDVYPWDYSIIAANGLNWKPRVVIQSYAAYTPWLDEQNAEHFRSEEAPRFILWELQKSTPDLNGGMFNSIDQRYLLNDEPRTLETVMTHYRFLMQDDRFLLLEHRGAPITLQHRELGLLKAAWGQWIPLPETGADQLRARVHIPKTLMRRLKSFLYKDEQFWIYLGLDDGSVHKYRIVPGNAADGLWITPYLCRTGAQRQVERILFRASGQHLMTDSIGIRWETLGWPEGSGGMRSFFGPLDENTDSLLLQSQLNPGEPLAPPWTGGEPYFSADAGMDGRTGIRLPGGAFSPAFSLPLDPLDADELRIQAEGWVKAPDYRGRGKVMLVISVDGPEGNVRWKGTSIDDQLIDRRHWNHMISIVDFRKGIPGAKLSVFFWNTGEEEVMIDGLSVRIWSRK
ncbi:MAG TPA: hypothetical protein P5550_02980 [Bacteroidales bacterium]|nr:hypothetical protein [Bacteroidales bacterium]